MKLSQNLESWARNRIRPTEAKNVWLVTKITWGGTTSYEVYAREAAANKACENLTGFVFTHAFQLEVK